MDGSFALAFLLVVVMSFVNTVMTVFGLAFWTTKRLDLRMRILISVCAAVIAVAIVFILFRNMIEFAEEPVAMNDQFGRPTTAQTIAYCLFASNVSGLLSLLVVTIVVVRARTSGWKSFLKWVSIPALVLHFGLTSLALLVIWSFTNVAEF